jgi:hypothetical protein
MGVQGADALLVDPVEYLDLLLLRPANPWLLGVGLQGLQLVGEQLLDLGRPG